MKVGVVKETAEREARVALVPDAVGKLVKAGLEVVVEAGAGAGASFTDEAYRDAGAILASNADEVLSGVDVLVKVQAPSEAEAAKLREGMVLVSHLQPSQHEALIKQLAGRNVTAFSLERIPRITRAQSMDVLSSQANLAGYQAVLIGASTLGRIMPMLMTAAGTIAPAKVFILGAGVAGLQAIATARRLGAVVLAFDVRAAVKEQVESLGARFVEVDLGKEDMEDKGGYAKELSDDAQRRQQELLSDTIAGMDLVVTTAAIPGKPAPKIITAEMVRGMHPGAAIVDLAAETGGNCELTEPGKTVVKHGVTIHGPLNVPSAVAVNASQMFARNVTTFLHAMIDDGKLNLDFDDEIIGATCVTHAGEVRA